MLPSASGFIKQKIIYESRLYIAEGKELISNRNGEDSL